MAEQERINDWELLFSYLNLLITDIQQVPGGDYFCELENTIIEMENGKISAPPTFFNKNMIWISVFKESNEIFKT